MNNTVRISLLGGSGSGKTCFIKGLVQALVDNAQHYGTENDPCDVMLNLERASGTNISDDIFDEQGDLDEGAKTVFEGANLSQILDSYVIRRGEKNLSESTLTGDIREFEFSLMINGVESCKMIITDYAGECITNFETNRNDFASLSKKLSQSDVLIFMTDAIVTCNNFGNRNDLQNQLRANWLTRMSHSIITNVEKRHGKLSVLIALTKSDSPLIEEKYKEDNFADVSRMLVKDVYDNIFTSLNHKNWNFGIIPVSCVGDNNVDTFIEDDNNIRTTVKADANIKQKNIDIAILYSLYLNIGDMINDLEDLKEQLILETKPFHRPPNYKKSDWIIKINSCQANIDRLKKCRSVLHTTTFNDPERYIHMRLPKAAVPQIV